MVGALRQNPPILSVASFRTWLESRPDEEHWELIEGVPMMVTHQIAAINESRAISKSLFEYCRYPDAVFDTVGGNFAQRSFVSSNRVAARPS